MSGAGGGAGADRSADRSADLGTGKNLVFLVGASRSGTTWLQRLLGAHPEVVTTQETALLDTYVAPLLDA